MEARSLCRAVGVLAYENFKVAVCMDEQDWVLAIDLGT